MVMPRSLLPLEFCSRSPWVLNPAARNRAWKQCAANSAWLAFSWGALLVATRCAKLKKAGEAMWVDLGSWLGLELVDVPEDAGVVAVGVFVLLFALPQPATAAATTLTTNAIWHLCDVFISSSSSGW